MASQFGQPIPAPEIMTQDQLLEGLAALVAQALQGGQDVRDEPRWGMMRPEVRLPVQAPGMVRSALGAPAPRDLIQTLLRRLAAAGMSVTPGAHIGYGQRMQTERFRRPGTEVLE